MFDPQIQIRHLHGDIAEPMVRRQHHDPADHDLERILARGGQIWRCERCEDEVIVMPDSAEGHAEPRR